MVRKKPCRNSNPLRPPIICAEFGKTRARDDLSFFFVLGALVSPRPGVFSCRENAASETPSHERRTTRASPTSTKDASAQRNARVDAVAKTRNRRRRARRSRETRRSYCLRKGFSLEVAFAAVGLRGSSRLRRAAERGERRAASLATCLERVARRRREAIARVAACSRA